MTDKNILKGLPSEAKKLFVKAFDKAFSKYKNEERAYSVAMEVLKQYYKRTQDKWILKSKVIVDSNIKKSGLFNPNLVFTAIVSSANRDYDNNYVSDSLLRFLSTSNRIQDVGDYDHLAFDEIEDNKGIFKKISHYYQDGKLYLKFLIDKAHNGYEKIKNEFKGKKIAELSAEFYNPVIQDGKIISADSLGWSICKDDVARNADAKVLKIEER